MLPPSRMRGEVETTFSNIHSPKTTKNRRGRNQKQVQPLREDRPEANQIQKERYRKFNYIRGLAYFTS